MTNDKEIKTLVPPLRFPEFLATEEWKDTTLEKEVYYENGKAHENDIDEYGKYIVVNSKFISADGEVVKYTNTPNCLAEKGDILMVLSDIPNGRAIAKCFIVDCDDKYTVNQRVCRLRSKNADGNLLYYIIDRNPYLLSFDDGVKQTNLKKEDVLNCPFRLPKGSSEQVKIADCLGSLGDLISAVTDKIEVLKEYKKGLMQQLFSPEGKTIPALRFPEFQNAGEWKETKLGKVGNPLMCRRVLKEQTTSGELDNVPFYKIGTFGGIADAYITRGLFEDFKRKYSYPNKGDILISAAGTIGRLVVYNGDPAYFQDSNIVWIENNEAKILNIFLYNVYQTLKWQTSDGGIVSRLYNADLKNMIIVFPENQEEQRKIANFLSSVDELIFVETNKLDQLKAHKKGLMQQLFPNLNE